MKVRAGSPQVPTEKQVQALIADLSAIQRRIEVFTISLTSTQRQATTKMRPGGDNIVALLAKLAKERGIALPEINVDDMSANLTVAKQLRPLADTSRQLQQRLDDTITNAQSDCWWTATALYSALARIAEGSPDLQTALQPAISFFARGRRKKGSATPVTPPVTPTKSAA
jgi:hypothetical protein